MSEFVLKPKELEVEAKEPDVQFEMLADELKGAEQAEGEEQVEQAVAEVQAGIAQPEALLEWIDDLRDPQEQRAPEDDNLERSFTMDFIPDTARDNAATENPPGDDFMFFSANRRDASADDDDGGGGGGGGGGSGDGSGEGAGEGEGGDAPTDADDNKKKASAAKHAKPTPAKPAKQPPKSDPPPPGKGGGGKKPDTK